MRSFLLSALLCSTAHAVTVSIEPLGNVSVLPFGRSVVMSPAASPLAPSAAAPGLVSVVKPSAAPKVAAQAAPSLFARVVDFVAAVKAPAKDGKPDDRAAARPFDGTEKKIGFYGGTFDPVHVGHLSVVDRAMEAYGLKKVVMFPNYRPADKEGANDFDQRYRLLKAAAKDRPEIVVPPAGVLKRLLGGPGGVEALKAWVKEHFPKSARIFQLMGTDSYEKLLKRPDAEAILGAKDAEIVVVERPGYKKPRIKAGVHWLESPKAPTFSSTRYQEDPLLGEAHLPRAVAKEIKRGGYYERSSQRGYHDLPESLTKLVDMEQTLNDRIENTAFFASIKKGNGLPKRYLPEERPVYYLYTVDVPIEKARIVAAGPVPAQLTFEKGGKKFIRFFVHPESKTFFQKALKGYRWSKEYLATPTSSHRSLIVWNPKTREAPLGVKVTLDVKIGQVQRLVTRGQIERAVAVSALAKTIAPELAKRGIRLMEEPAGVMLKDLKFGYLLRTYPSHLPEGVNLVPMFSLYSKPARGPPMVVKMAEASRLPVREFVQKFFIDPLVGQAAYMAFEHGLVGEPHEQNVLMEVKDGKPTRNYWYRDLSGFWVNKEMREAAGKDLSFLPKGVELGEAKAGRGDFAEQTRTFVLDSNLFALREALKTDFPQVTDAWLEKAFEQTLRRETRRWKRKA